MKYFKLLSRLLTNFPYHPILLAAFPVLALYSFNIRELTVGSFIKPLLIVILVLILVFLLMDIVFKNFYKTGVLLSLLVFIFFSHGHFHNLIGEGGLKLPFTKLGTDELIFLIWFLLIATVIVSLFKVQTSFKRLTKILNFISVLLVGFAIFNIFSFEISTQRIIKNSLNTSSKSLNKSGVNISYKPDIYYLIFDRYTSNSALSKYFKFDNSEFTSFLEKNGFIVDKNAKTNYPKTLLSLASSLNMEYINNRITQTAIKNNDETGLYPLLQDHAVGKYLKSKGYVYHHLGSWFEPTKTNKLANKNYVLQGEFLPIDSFSFQLIETTVIAPILRKISPKSSLSSFATQHHNRVLYQFDNLNRITKIQSPKFVFAHVLAPHEPYVFDKNCNKIKSVFTDNKRFEEIGYYNEQLQCTNKKIKNLINTIVKESDKPPIIILQADEGTSNYRSILNKPSKKESEVEQYTKRFGILNALYLPSIDKSTFMKSLTPVNTFRFIFNSYFKENLSYYPNKYYYFEDPTKFLDLFEVTKKVQNL